jgi:hypothetical protein
MRILVLDNFKIDCELLVIAPYPEGFAGAFSEYEEFINKDFFD